MARDGTYRSGGKLHTNRSGKYAVRGYPSRSSNQNRQQKPAMSRKAKKTAKQTALLEAMAQGRGMFSKLAAKTLAKRDAQAGAAGQPAGGLAGMIQQGISKRKQVSDYAPATPLAPETPDITRPIPTMAEPAPTPTPVVPDKPQPAPATTTEQVASAGRPMPGAGPAGSGFRNRR